MATDYITAAATVIGCAITIIGVYVRIKNDVIAIQIKMQAIEQQQNFNIADIKDNAKKHEEKSEELQATLSGIDNKLAVIANGFESLSKMVGEHDKYIRDLQIRGK